MIVAQRFDAGCIIEKANESGSTKETFCRPWRDLERYWTVHPSAEALGYFRRQYLALRLNSASSNYQLPATALKICEHECLANLTRDG
jgi:hypothetical protein